MKLLREIFDFYIDSSIHVSIAVLSLQAVIMIKYCSIINNELLLFTFFSTLFAYNFIKYAQHLIYSNNQISKKLIAIIFISIISLLISLFLSRSLSFYELIIVLLSGILNNASARHINTIPSELDRSYSCISFSKALYEL